MKDKLIGALGIAGIYLFYGVNLLLALMPCLMLGLPWWGVILVCLAQLILPFPNLQQAVLFAFSFSNAIKPPIDVFTVLYFISFVIFVYCFIISILKFIRSLG